MGSARATFAGYALTGLFALFMPGASIAPKLPGMTAAAKTLTSAGGAGWG